VTAILLLYSLTLFVSATLLFVVQPMVGKMILPLLGGTPAVWSTCMVFFQAMLLAGYAYAHASATWVGISRQAILHLAVLAIPLGFLPLTVNPALLRGGEANPVLGVLLLLSISVGLPFFVVSATAPLLQRWFSHTSHPSGRDPYFLYAASNLGSMLALLGYPTLIEPRLHLRDSGWLSQMQLWSLGYFLLAVLTALCALTLWRGVAARTTSGSSEDAVASVTESAEPPDETNGDGLSLSRRLRWVALAFVPSSLLLGVTTYITTDIAAVPLLWVLPLAIYLLSFILAFGYWPPRLHRAVTAALLPLTLLVVFFMVSGFRQRIWITVIWHLALLLVVALSCHGELALSRPSPRHLTEFYLLISGGGVLGGVFNALVAPLVFSSLVEYPLAMLLACVLVGWHRAAPPATRRAHLLTAALPLAVAALALILYSDSFSFTIDFRFLSRLFHFPAESVTAWLDPLERKVNTILAYAPPLALCLLLRRRPMLLGLSLAAVLMVTDFVDARNSDQILQARSFFGVLQVSRDRDATGYTSLHHGTTLHGLQSLDPARRGEPLSYYHRQGPIGQVFTELDRRDGSRRVAVIGLGTGTLAAYARPGDGLTFYEIDRLARDIASNRAYFTYLTDARERGATLRIELGDARIRLEAVGRERPGERYDLIVVDAFTSDAIPVHLLTREALRLYLERLKPGGLLAFHLSNRFLTLEPVVANLAGDAGLAGQIEEDESEETKGVTGSTWAVLARTPEALGGLAHDARWTPAEREADPRVGVWTDDFHNLLSVFKWR
jgi:SAM-dependent methyltransferase